MINAKNRSSVQRLLRVLTRSAIVLGRGVMSAKTESAALADDAPHLLVVDDDSRIRELLSRYLRGEGYRVTTSETAADARAKLGDCISTSWCSTS